MARADDPVWGFVVCGVVCGVSGNMMHNETTCVV